MSNVITKAYGIVWKIFAVLFAIDFCLGFVYGWNVVRDINPTAQAITGGIIAFTSPIEALACVAWLLLLVPFLVIKKRS